MQINLISNGYVFLQPKTKIPSFSIKGIVKTKSAITSGILVRLFSRSDAILIGQTLTLADGSYEFTTYDTKEKFIIAHHSKRNFNAVISDNVVPK